MRKVMLLCLTLGLAACDAVGLSEVMEPALLGIRGINVHFVVPDSVTRGSQFEIEFDFHGTDCTRLVEVKAQTEGRIARIEPIVATQQAECTLALRRNRTRHGLTFEVMGSAEVQLIGKFEQRDTTLVRQTWVR